MMQEMPFENIIRRNQHGFHRVVDFDPGKDKLLPMDFTEKNTALSSNILDDIGAFSDYIDDKLKKASA